MKNQLIREQLLPFARAGDVMVALGFPRPSRDLLKRWRRHGVNGHKLQARRLGARFYISEASVREFVEACDDGVRNDSP